MCSTFPLIITLIHSKLTITCHTRIFCGTLLMIENSTSDVIPPPPYLLLVDVQCHFKVFNKAVASKEYCYLSYLRQ